MSGATSDRVMFGIKPIATTDAATATETPARVSRNGKRMVAAPPLIP